MRDDDVYRCTDMGTVAYLKYVGHEALDCQRIEGEVVWVFLPSEDLFADLETFTLMEATVEPKKYNAFFASVKRELHRA